MDIKKLFTTLGTHIIMLLLAGGILLYISVPKLVVSFKPAISFKDMLDGAEVKAGSHVAGDVVFAMDYFASQSTYTRYSDGSRSGDRASGNYYLIPTYDGFIGLKCRQADVAAFDRLTDETYDFLENGIEPTDRIFIEGNVKTMESKLAKYFREYLDDMGYTENEIADMGEPLVLEYVDFNAVRIMSVIGVALVALGIFFWRRGYQRA